jgi:protein-tyrosine phosphatase
MEADLPRLDGVTNFRELGGLPTEDGRRVRSRALFRSGHWGFASDDDVEHLARLGVGIVVDFRTELDVELEGSDRLSPGIEHVPIPTGDPASATDVRKLIQDGDLDTLREHFGDGRAEQYMMRGATAMVTERSETFSAFLHRLAEPGCPPALFHCSAGKDRAGWAASCLLLALGVQHEHVVDHYLLSNDTFDPDKQRGAWVDTGSEIAELLAPLVRVRAEYIEASIEAASKQWGSLDGYFHDALGLSDDDREQLHHNWLSEERGRS